jgi:hypothetical protein
VKAKVLCLRVEELEQRIAPDAIGNPGNNNPPLTTRTTQATKVPAARCRREVRLQFV